MADLVAMDEIAKAIRNKVPAPKLRKISSLTKIQKEWLERRIKKANFSEKMRLRYYLGVILNDEDEVQECFRTIQSEVLASTIKNLSYNENARIVTDKHTVKLPLRVNWGGGWQDQVGGITPGLKYITSMPGIEQQLKVTRVSIGVRPR